MTQNKDYECIIMLDLHVGLKVLLGTANTEDELIKDCAEIQIQGDQEKAGAVLVPLGDLEYINEIPHAIFRLSKKSRLYQQYVKFRSGLIIPGDGING